MVLPLLLQKSDEIVMAEPGVQKHLTVVFGDPAPQLGVDRYLVLPRPRQVAAGEWRIVGVMEQERSNVCRSGPSINRQRPSLTFGAEVG